MPKTVTENWSRMYWSLSLCSKNTSAQFYATHLISLFVDLRDGYWTPLFLIVVEPVNYCQVGTTYHRTSINTTYSLPCSFPLDMKFMRRHIALCTTKEPKSWQKNWRTTWPVLTWRCGRKRAAAKTRRLRHHELFSLFFDCLRLWWVARCYKMNCEIYRHTVTCIPTQRGQPPKMRVHLENSWNIMEAWWI